MGSQLIFLGFLQGFELLFFQILAPVLLISGSKGLNFRLFQGYSKFSISGKLGFGFDTTLFFTLRQCLSTIDRRCHATNWFYLKNRSKRLYESAILAQYDQMKRQDGFSNLADIANITFFFVKTWYFMVKVQPNSFGPTTYVLLVCRPVFFFAKFQFFQNFIWPLFMASVAISH